LEEISWYFVPDHRKHLGLSNFGDPIYDSKPNNTIYNGIGIVRPQDTPKWTNGVDLWGYVGHEPIGDFINGVSITTLQPTDKFCCTECLSRPRLKYDCSACACMPSAWYLCMGGGTFCELSNCVLTPSESGGCSFDNCKYYGCSECPKGAPKIWYVQLDKDFGGLTRGYMLYSSGCQWSSGPCCKCPDEPPTPTTCCTVWGDPGTEIQVTISGDDCVHIVSNEYGAPCDGGGLLSGTSATLTPQDPGDGEITIYYVGFYNFGDDGTIPRCTVYFWTLECSDGVLYFNPYSYDESGIFFSLGTTAMPITNCKPLMASGSTSPIGDLAYCPDLTYTVTVLGTTGWPTT